MSLTNTALMLDRTFFSCSTKRSGTLGRMNQMSFVLIAEPSAFHISKHHDVLYIWHYYYVDKLQKRDHPSDGKLQLGCLDPPMPAPAGEVALLSCCAAALSQTMEVRP